MSFTVFEPRGGRHVESHSCRTACLHTMSWKRSWRFACASCAR